MLNPLKSLGDLNKMRKQALEIQKQLEQERIEIEEGGIKVVVSGDQKILKLEVDGEEKEDLKKVLNKAIKSAQETAARKLAAMSGGLQGLLRS